MQITDHFVKVNVIMYLDCTNTLKYYLPIYSDFYMNWDWPFMEEKGPSGGTSGSPDGLSWRGTKVVARVPFAAVYGLVTVLNLTWRRTGLGQTG